MYEFPEAEGIGYTIRLPTHLVRRSSNRALEQVSDSVLQDHICPWSTGGSDRDERCCPSLKSVKKGDPGLQLRRESGECRLIQSKLHQLPPLLRI
jgi:hypothetical protein